MAGLQVVYDIRDIAQLQQISSQHISECERQLYEYISAASGHRCDPRIPLDFSRKGCLSLFCTTSSPPSKNVFRKSRSTLAFTT